MNRLAHFGISAAAVTAIMWPWLAWTAELRWQDSGEWRLAGRPSSSPKRQLAYARSLEEQGVLARAEREYSLLVRHYPDSPEAGGASVGAARCMFLADRSAEAVETLWRALSLWPEGARAADGVELAFAIGKCIMDGAGGRQADLDRAVAIFERVLRIDPAGAAADDATLCLGKALEGLGKLAEAAAQYERLCKTFPGSPCREEAERRLGACRMRGETGGTDAGATAPDMRRRVAGPEGGGDLKKEFAEADVLEAEKKYRRGLFYMGQGKNEAARVSMKAAIERGPGTKWAALAKEALDRLGGGEEQSR